MFDIMNLWLNGFSMNLICLNFAFGVCFWAAAVWIVVHGGLVEENRSMRL